MRRCTIYIINQKCIVVCNSRDKDWIWFETSPFFIVDLEDHSGVVEAVKKCLDKSKLNTSQDNNWESIFFNEIGYNNYNFLYTNSKVIRIANDGKKYNIIPYKIKGKGKNLALFPDHENEILNIENSGLGEVIYKIVE